MAQHVAAMDRAAAPRDPNGRIGENIDFNEKSAQQNKAAEKAKIAICIGEYPRTTKTCGTFGKTSGEFGAKSRNS